MHDTMIKSKSGAASKNGHQVRSLDTVPTNSRPDPQVVERPTRRTFTAEYKHRILKEADACTRHGELGALLRREGLYSSLLAAFRKQQQDGHLADPAQKKQQRKQREAERQRDARQIARLESENHKLRALLELQKKLSDLIGLPLLTEMNE